MSVNLWTTFQRLNQQSPIIVARVVQVLEAEGASVVQTAGGGRMRVLGDTLGVGSAAFVRDGRILAKAPDLPHYELTV